MGFEYYLETKSTHLTLKVKGLNQDYNNPGSNETTILVVRYLLPIPASKASGFGYGASEWCCLFICPKTLPRAKNALPHFVFTYNKN